MIKEKIFLAMIAASVSLSQAQTKPDIETRIKRTAEALGVSVYEDLPVSKGSFSSLNSFAYSTDGFVVPFNRSDFAMIPEPTIDPKNLPKPHSLSIGERISIYWSYVSTFWDLVLAKIYDSGLFSADAPTFEDISKRLLAKTESKNFKPGKPNEKSLLENEGFLREFEKLVGSAFIDGNKVKYLIDGEESFKYKDYLIKNAKKSVYITTWAFYDDITGEDALNMLTEAKKRGVDVKIILDAKIASSYGISIVKRMEKAGIELLKYKENGRPADVWHVKMVITDGDYVIVGGMNFGDPYSHKDPLGPKWRDSDVLIMGPAVAKAQELFAKIWNSEIKKSSLNLPMMSQTYQPSQPVGNARISFSFSNPPQAEGSDVLSAIIKAIRGANKKINIENAYFVPIPALTQALLEAMSAGVQVNIFTNSKGSIDSQAKLVSDISMKSMLPLYKAGASIYLKRGDTLHSKFITVDGVFVSIGSYNLHPRSERYDSELNANIVDPETTAILDKIFERDITNMAVKVTSESQLVSDQSWISSIVEKDFFDQLSRK